MKEADLNNEFKYDKIILSIDGKSCSTNNPGKASYYIDLLEPLRNVVYIKILNARVQNSSAITSSPYDYIRNDPIYICLNDFNRSNTYIKNVDITTGKTYLNKALYFDLIPYLPNSEFSTISYLQSSFDWTDPTVYILNPPEPSLRRFDISIKDKNYNLLNTEIITDFNITICIYFIKNRV
jgi:hypothetical protein